MGMPFESNLAPDTPYWSRPAADLMTSLGSAPGGLRPDMAAQRLAQLGPNRPKPAHAVSAAGILLRQFANPLVLILVVAAAISAAVGEAHEATIISLIVLASALLSFTQEWGASRAMTALRERLSHKVTVVRSGSVCTIAAEEVVPGDVVRLTAGALIPGDGVIVEAHDFNVSEAVLTGETFPVIKSAGLSPADAPLTGRGNAVFAGTSVRSGTADVLIVRAGQTTEFARIAEAVARQVPETDFARGIRHFGNLMTQIMLVMVIIVFAANLLLHRPLIDSLLFSLALAVGITPELLPAIISITLSRGARRMAEGGVIVRRLDTIENLGSMNVLCTDKTGTLTEGVIRLDGAVDLNGAPSAGVLDLARMNAALQTGLPNPLDAALLAAGGDAPDAVKLGEVAYDFERKRLSVAVRTAHGDLLICKGAVANVLAVCTGLDDAARAACDQRFRTWSEQGYRVLAVATRPLEGEAVNMAAERDLTLAGFLLFFDPPKAGIADTLAALAHRGIRIKMITGDNRYVARHVAEAVGLKAGTLLTGADIARMSADALFAAAPVTAIFAEIDPNQKERIIAALRKAGHVVGYLGDGINDAPALHEADVGISVDGAVEVAREAADMVMLKQDLRILLHGVDEGRKTFVNTMKYISITTSANFGNMISMALASLFLPFLPLLAKQILLNNFLSDVPSMAIATDRVDPGATRSPRRWSVAYIRRFMIVFGLVSSLFDVLTFAFLLWASHLQAAPFQTGWFIESLVTELGIVLVIRTRRPAWKSRPGALLMQLTGVMALIAAVLPYTPLAGWFGLVPLPLTVMAGLAGITVLYLAVSEGVKHLFFAAEQRRHTSRSPHAV